MKKTSRTKSGRPENHDQTMICDIDRSVSVHSWIQAVSLTIINKCRKSIQTDDCRKSYEKRSYQIVYLYSCK
jgi:hypothetical protein